MIGSLLLDTQCARSVSWQPAPGRLPEERLDESEIQTCLEPSVSSGGLLAACWRGGQWVYLPVQACPHQY